MELLTVADIAKELNIPQSTARFYRDRYEGFIPCVGEGRNRRYEREAVEAFGIIADGYKFKQPSTTIENRLQERFGIIQQTATESEQQTAAMVMNENQPITEQVMTLLIEQQKVLIAKVSELESKIEEQRIAQIHLDSAIEQERTERKKEFEERDQRLMQMRQIVKEIKEKRNRSIFEKLFNR